MRKLRSEGLAILFVTHFLDQMYEISDRVTILRNGKFEGEYMAKELTRLNLVMKMIGKELNLLEELPVLAEASKEKKNEAFVKAEGLGRKGAIEPFDLSISKGEVIGLAGLLGSGRTEAARLLFGADKPDTGKLTFAEGEEAYIRRAMRFIGALPSVQKTGRPKASLTTLLSGKILFLLCRPNWDGSRPSPASVRMT